MIFISINVETNFGRQFHFILYKNHSEVFGFSLASKHFRFRKTIWHWVGLFSSFGSSNVFDTLLKVSWMADDGVERVGMWYNTDKAWRTLSHPDSNYKKNSNDIKRDWNLNFETINSKN